MMPLNERLAGVNAQWGLLTAYQKFEQVIILILTAMIAVVVVLAVRNLALKILFGIVLSNTLDPSDYVAFAALRRRARSAIVRKLLILDFARTDAQELFGLAAAILALGIVHWLVRDQDLREAVNEGTLDPTSPIAPSRM
jgi:uncharacterized membrane protein (DUF373 family)